MKKAIAVIILAGIYAGGAAIQATAGAHQLNDHNNRTAAAIEAQTR